MNAPAKIDQANAPILVVGLGLTGWSVVRYLLALGEQVVVTDTRKDPPYLGQLQAEFPGVLFVPEMPADEFESYREVIASPGLAVDANNVIGDIELFLRVARAPVIAITGSNGKSTVTMLVGEILNAGSYSARVGGNIGTPALDLLELPIPDFYVLELSSFQLETTFSLAACSAAVLNITEDHLDRYAGFEEYAAAKLTILQQAKCSIFNRDDPVIAALPRGSHDISFGLSAPEENQFGLVVKNNSRFIYQGTTPIAPLSSLALQGEQNIANVMAAMALVVGAGIVLEANMVAAALEYSGLPHRCELVCMANGVKWINDSKGTNVGATLAAIYGSEKPLILIAGGQGKGANFRALGTAVTESVKAVILIGEDAEKIQNAVDAANKTRLADTLEDAVVQAAQLADSGDTILFSPACASFDMFESYAHRGEKFIQLVKKHVQEVGDA